jgi:hypothetical protein
MESRMSFEGKTKPTVFMNPFVEKILQGQVYEEIEGDGLREDLWAKALKKCRSDTQKTKALYIEYRVRAIREEAVIANTLSIEHSDIIIQRYLSKTQKHVSSSEKKNRTNKQDNIAAKGFHRKKCFKCGKVITLAVKPCPECDCNSFIFCK